MMTRHWFQQKSFGYGAIPNTWQGGTLTIGGAIAICAVTIAARWSANEHFCTLADLGAAVVVIPMVVVGYIKTEGGARWRFGK